ATSLTRASPPPPQPSPARGTPRRSASRGPRCGGGSRPSAGRGSAPSERRGRAARGRKRVFRLAHRGKESVVLDLARTDDKALLSAMLAKADVFVQNLKPGAIARLALALAELRRGERGLVMWSMCG